MASSSGTLYRLFRRSAITKFNLRAPPTPPAQPKPSARQRGQAAERLAAAIFVETDLDAVVTRFKAASASARFRAKHRVYSATIRRLAAAGRHVAISEILEAQKLYPDVAHEGFAARLIALYGAAGMPAAAEKTFAELPNLGCRRSVLSFNALLNSVDRASKKTLFAAAPAGVVVDAVSYNILLTSECAAGDVDGALQLFDEMLSKEIRPTVITFNILLNGLYCFGRFEEAKEMWEKMGSYGCEPNLGSYNAKVKGLVTAGRMDEAQGVVEKMEAPGTVTFNYLIKGYCERGEVGKARKVFDEMPKRGCCYNKETLEVLVPRLLDEGEVELAARACRESVGGKFKVGEELFRAVAEELARCSGTEEAESLLKLAGLETDIKKMNTKAEDDGKEPTGTIRTVD